MWQSVLSVNLFHVVIFADYSGYDDLYGSEFSGYGDGYFGYDNLYCDDDIDCVVNCEGPGACHFAAIYGPANASLTVNCEIYRACDHMSIDAQESINLYINVNYALSALSNTDIHTPTSNATNTYITCGILCDMI